MRRLALLVSIAPIATIGAAHAQEAAPPNLLPETVITATRVATPAERVPAATTIIDRQTIEERGYTTLAEALATVPGLHIVQSGGYGQPATAFTRGTNGRHTLVLLDGVPLNDAANPNGAFDFGQEMLGDIERIEVLRGPASALYGSSAIGGVINLVTRRAPANREAQAFGEVAGGSNNTLRGTAGVAGTVGMVDYMAALQSMSTRGADATAPRFFNNTGEREGFRGYAGTMRLGVQPTRDTRIEGLFRYRDTYFGLDDVPNDDPNYRGNDRNWMGVIRAETKPVEPWTLSLRYARTQERRSYNNLPDSFSFSETHDYYRGWRDTVDLGNQIRLPDIGIVNDIVLVAGVTWQKEQADQLSGSTFFQTSTVAASESHALHTALQFRLGERLDVALGLRHDAADDYKDADTWRIGATYAIPEIQTRLTGSAGTAFAAPSLYQRYGRIPGIFEGNPDLRPERSYSWELGAETDLPLFGRRDFATVGATYFHSRVRDLINFNPSFDSMENVDRANIEGWELGLTLRPADWLETKASWTITEARDAETKQPLPRRPEHVVTLNARIAPMPRLVIAPEVLFTGRSLENAYASYADDGSSYATSRYNRAGTVWNLTASYVVVKGMTAFVEGRNLGNSRYEPANGFVVPGRTAIVGVRAVF
ncbi:TonB-dependent receptor [Acetobacteraceae bacterium H6797]|nr:TonB-dependent receptor [Acetobacteraceae bacterium H6797]